MTLERTQQVQAEFSRQADAMLASRRFTNEAALDRLRNLAGATPEQRVLDLACGPGIVTEALAGSAGLVVGLDITEGMVTRCRDRNQAAGNTNVACLQGDSSNLPFASNSFDVVVTRSAVHHFSEPAVVLAEVHRILRPGGVLTVSDVVSSEEPDESKLHNAFETLRDPTHVRMLPESVLLKLVADTGFEIQSVDSTTASREYGEWLAITSAPERSGPLRILMEELAHAGIGAGVQLRIDDGRLLFEHRTLLVRAIKSGS